MKALQEQGYRIGDLCAAFGVSRSGYHRARTAAPSARACKDAELAAELRELHRQSRGTYGRPRLTIALRQRGQRHSAKRVARLLRSLGLRGVRRGPRLRRSRATRLAECRCPRCRNAIVSRGRP